MESRKDGLVDQHRGSLLARADLRVHAFSQRTEPNGSGDELGIPALRGHGLVCDLSLLCPGKARLRFAEGTPEARLTDVEHLTRARQFLNRQAILER